MGPYKELWGQGESSRTLGVSRTLGEQGLQKAGLGRLQAEPTQLDASRNVYWLFHFPEIPSTVRHLSQWPTEFTSPHQQLV